MKDATGRKLSRADQAEMDRMNRENAQAAHPARSTGTTQDAARGAGRRSV